MFPFIGKTSTSTIEHLAEIQAQYITREWECQRFCWSLGTRTGRDFSGFLRGLFGRKLEWQKHWHRHYTTVRATQCTQGGGLEAFIAYHCEGSTNAQHHCELGGTQGCWRHLLAGLHTNPAGSTPTNTLDLLQTLPFAHCSVFVFVFVSVFVFLFVFELVSCLHTNPAGSTPTPQICTVWSVYSGQTRRTLFLGRVWVYERPDCCSRTL